MTPAKGAHQLLLEFVAMNQCVDCSALTAQKWTLAEAFAAAENIPFVAGHHACCAGPHDIGAGGHDAGTLELLLMLMTPVERVQRREAA